MISCLSPLGRCICFWNWPKYHLRIKQLLFELVMIIFNTFMIYISCGFTSEVHVFSSYILTLWLWLHLKSNDQTKDFEFVTSDFACIKYCKIWLSGSRTTFAGNLGIVYPSSWDAAFTINFLSKWTTASKWNMNTYCGVVLLF